MGGAARRRGWTRVLGLVGPTMGWLVWASAAGAEVLVADDFEYFPPASGVHTVSPPAGTGGPLLRVWDQVVYWHKSAAIQIICDGTAASGDCYLSENFIPAGQGAAELRDHADKEPTLWKAPTEEAWIRHFVRWPAGWEWPRHFSGLKLGRLRLAPMCRPDGPCINTNWGPQHDDPSRIWWSYGYTQDGKSWGGRENLISGRWPGGFQTNRWYCLELHVRQNTRLSPPDGVLELFVDGVQVAATMRADTRGDSGPGTLPWTVFSLTDNFVGSVRGAAATEKTPALHFDGVVFGTTRPGCPAPTVRP